MIVLSVDCNIQLNILCRLTYKDLIICFGEQLKYLISYRQTTIPTVLELLTVQDWQSANTLLFTFCRSPIS